MYLLYANGINSTCLNHRSHIRPEAETQALFGKSYGLIRGMPQPNGGWGAPMIVFSELEMQRGGIESLNVESLRLRMLQSSCQVISNESAVDLHQFFSSVPHGANAFS